MGRHAIKINANLHIHISSMVFLACHSVTQPKDMYIQNIEIFWYWVSKFYSNISILILYSVSCQQVSFAYLSGISLNHVFNTSTTFGTLAYWPPNGNVNLPSPSTTSKIDTRSIFKQSLTGLSFPSPRLVGLARIKSPVCPTIYP